MKRVIMSIVLLASTAVAEGQDRVQQGPAPAGAGPTPRRPRAPRRLSSSSYLNSNWFGSGQIPERAVRGSRPRG
jgi:hypothetical protein